MPLAPLRITVLPLQTGRRVSVIDAQLASPAGRVAVQRATVIAPRPDADLPTHDTALRKDRPVILYCGSGGRAALAGKTLVDMGYTDVRNVGGFKGLVDAGWEVEPG